MFRVLLFQQGPMVIFEAEFSNGKNSFIEQVVNMSYVHYIDNSEGLTKGSEMMRKEFMDTVQYNEDGPGKIYTLTYANDSEVNLLLCFKDSNNIWSPGQIIRSGSR